MRYLAAGICGGVGPGAADAVDRMLGPPPARGGPWGRLSFPGPGVHLACEELPRVPGLPPNGPARSEDGLLGAVFAGWLHDAPPGVGDEPSVSHRLLRLYEREGEDFLRRLDGRWVLALWDGRRERLLLARDVTGQRVVYHLEDRGGLFFASRIKTLIRSGRSSRRLDPAAVDTLLTLRRVPGRGTVLEGARRLGPGHKLSWSDGRARIAPYLEVEPPVRPQSLAEATARFGEAADRAVADACPPGQTVGVYFSGGIDSTTLLERVWRHTAGDAQAFTFLAGKEFGDFQSARDWAGRHGVPHTEVDSRSVPFEEVFPEALWVLDDPVADLSVVNPFMLARTASSRVRFSVDGIGPDQALGGCFYHRPLYYLLRFGSLPGVARLLRLLGRGVGASPVDGLHRLIERLEPAYSVDPEGRRRIARLLALADRPREVVPLLIGLFQDEQRQALYTDDFGAEVTRAGRWEPPPAVGSAGTPEEQMMRLFRYEVLESLTHCQSRVSESFGQYHGLEHGAPFMTPRVLDVLLGLPMELRIRAGQNKILLRRIQQQQRERVHRQPKQAGNIALDRVWGRRILAFCGDVLTPERIRQAGLFRPEAVEELFRNARERTTMFPCMSLAAVATVELWRQMFLESSC